MSSGSSYVNAISIAVAFVVVLALKKLFTVGFILLALCVLSTMELYDKISF